jgi:hypothetical protein
LPGFGLVVIAGRGLVERRRRIGGRRALLADVLELVADDLHRRRVGGEDHHVTDGEGLGADHRAGALRRRPDVALHALCERAERRRQRIGVRQRDQAAGHREGERGLRIVGAVLRFGDGGRRLVAARLVGGALGAHRIGVVSCFRFRGRGAGCVFLCGCTIFCGGLAGTRGGAALERHLEPHRPEAMRVARRRAVGADVRRRIASLTSGPHRAEHTRTGRAFGPPKRAKSP